MPSALRKRGGGDRALDAKPLGARLRQACGRKERIDSTREYPAGAAGRGKPQAAHSLSMPKTGTPSSNLYTSAPAL